MIESQYRDDSESRSGVGRLFAPKIWGVRYPANPRIDRNSKPRSVLFNQDRDERAHKLLDEVVRPAGYIFDDVFNVSGAAGLDEASVRSRFRSDDIVTISTRPPLHDHDKALHFINMPSGLVERHGPPQKKVLEGNNWLEEQIFKGLRAYIRHCCRRCIALTPEGASALAPGYEKRELILFQDDADALYVRPNSKAWLRTAAYIVYLRELWPAGPSCLSLFGMSGATTLGFAKAIYFRCSEELVFKDSELIFVEISVPRGSGPLVPKDSQAFSDYWQNWKLAWHRRGLTKPRIYAPLTVMLRCRADS